MSLMPFPKCLRQSVLPAVRDQTSGPSSSSRELPADSPGPQPVEVRSEEVKQEEKVEERKEPSPSMTLPLALYRIHQKLSSPTELLKLHLKHYHMSLDKFKKRTSALKLPKDIYDKYEHMVKQCETCQKVKVAPSRSKVSGIRSETFGELTFVDHGEVPLTREQKLMFLILYDGATTLTTAYCVQSKSESETIKHLANFLRPISLIRNTLLLIKASWVLRRSPTTTDPTYVQLR